MSRIHRAAALILFGVGLAGCSSHGSIPWLKDYEGALQEAKRRQLPVITYLFTDWCTYCKQMEASTFQDSRLTREMKDQYLWVKLNAETDAEGVRLREQFGVSGYPAIVVLDSQGREMDRMEGYIPADEFKANVERFLSAPDSFGRIHALVDQHPESFEARYSLGMAYLDRENFTEAREQFQQIIDQGSEDDGLIVPSSYYYLSYALASMGKTDDALARLDELRKVFPDSPVLADALALQGQVYLSQGRNQEARNTFREYLDGYPDHGNRDRIRRMLDETTVDMGMSLVASH